MTVCVGCGLIALHYHGSAALPADAGGIIGSFMGSGLAGLVNPLGGTLFLLALFLTGVTLFTGLSWLEVMDVTGRCTIALAQSLHRLGLLAWDRWLAGRLKQAREARTEEEENESTPYQPRLELEPEREDTPYQASLEAEREHKPRRRAPRIKPAASKIETSIREEREKQAPLFEPGQGSEALPPLALLDLPKEERRRVSDESLEAMSRQVELKLADFGIAVEVVAVHPGPVVTRYEMQRLRG